jgi:riboflavin transporter FmnP
MVMLLEVYPIVGITDLKFSAGGTPFTIDWTGIPLVIVFLGLGFVYSLFATAAMFIAIAYRNPAGGVFKLFAEAFTLLGLLIARELGNKLNASNRNKIVLYLFFGIVCRAVGMFFMNIILLPVLWPVWYTTEAAIAASTLLVPWNAVQAVINVVAGIFFFERIPKELAATVGFGESTPSTTIQELPEIEEEESS